MYRKNIVKNAILVIIILATTAFSQTVFEENFDYTANDPLTNHGWSAHSASGTNAIKVFSPGLTYAGYASSGIGNAVKVDTGGEDVNKTFTTTTDITTYTAFMINVQKATLAGDYCFHLSTSPLNSYEYGSRFHVKSNASGSIAFGVGKKHLDTAFTSFSYALNTTYLIVLKYEFVAGDSNDQLSMFVFTSGVPTTEPGTPTVGPTTPPGSDFPHIGSVVLRQGTYANAPRVIIDGIRVANSWSGAVSGIEDNPVSPIKQLNFQVYPNPFKNNVTVRFNNAFQEIKELQIFDICGNQIKTFSSVKSNTVSWNAYNDKNQLVVPGVYFIVLKTDNGNKTEKVLLSK